MRATLLLASLAACSQAFLLPSAPGAASSRVAPAAGTCVAGCVCCALRAVASPPRVMCNTAAEGGGGIPIHTLGMDDPHVLTIPPRPALTSTQPTSREEHPAIRGDEGDVAGGRAHAGPPGTFGNIISHAHTHIHMHAFYGHTYAPPCGEDPAPPHPPTIPTTHTARPRARWPSPLCTCGWTTSATACTAPRATSAPPRAASSSGTRSSPTYVH